MPFYIEVYGKSILLFDSDMPNIEHITIAERCEYKVGDHIAIVNINRVDNAEENGFYEGVDYKITNTVGDRDIIITNNKTELWIKENEFPYIKQVNSLAPIISETTVDSTKDIQKLIDEALDCRDFKTLEKLVTKLNAIK
ncbi:hypothetical protein FJQ98_16440 [Lysinibacillus agricola]|uniref:IDEAL domain-containing protein n=1 Tax=Lysinibacillus agricola TaxID=2590012 RepID=A0ABX7ARG8_9BACI|nr:MULTISPECIES: hypothetical protein [Lysinibacillus]KOS61479.1 hypothetical protein AN161_17975 [Lysinibacillus sp. FJAT-14222]QQP10834.1 hypothetical protein FJQ98_16440 [Lysinibacillus agricola]